MTALYGPPTRPEGFPVLPDAIRTVPFQQVTGPDTGRQYAALTALAVTSADTYPVPVVTPEPQPVGAARRMSRNDKLLLAGIYVALVAANVAIFPPLRHEVMAGYDRAWPGVLAAPAAGVAVLGWRARSKVRAFAVALAGAAPWPLLAVLTVQAVLSLRLVWSNTAFTDEALYLWAGHLEWAHWLHGTAIPAFPTYFSGAPVIYPSIGALADSIGGLAAARLLSLAFMLGATCMLRATAAQLFGDRAAFFAIALWATLPSTQFLGAFATYDAMSLFLMATAAWCAVHVGGNRKASGWLVATAVALVGANATKYASGIFDPIVVTLVMTTGMQTSPWKQAAARTGTLLAYAFSIIGFILMLGGGEYITGISETTLARAAGTSTAYQVLGEAWQLTAIVVILALAGALVGMTTERAVGRRILIAALAGAALLVPLEQARVHTTFALHKHVDFGAWFAAIAAAYVMNQLAARSRMRFVQGVATAICLGIIAWSAHTGVAQAWARFHDWSNSASLTAELRHILPATSGPILVSSPTISEYYLPEGTQWYRWSNLYTIRLLDGRTISSGTIGQKDRIERYETGIRNGFFAVVVINLSGSNVEFNQRLLPVLEQNPHYRLANEVPYWNSQIWLYTPQGQVHYRIQTAGAAPLGGLLTPAPRLSPVLGPVTLVVCVSGAAVLVFTILVRFAWRRRKAADEA